MLTLSASQGDVEVSGWQGVAAFEVLAVNLHEGLK